MSLLRQLTMPALDYLVKPSGTKIHKILREIDERGTRRPDEGQGSTLLDSMAAQPSSGLACRS